MVRIREDAIEIISIAESDQPEKWFAKQQARRVLILLDALEEVVESEEKHYPDCETWEMADVARKAIAKAEEV